MWSSFELEVVEVLEVFFSPITVMLVFFHRETHFPVTGNRYFPLLHLAVDVYFFLNLFYLLDRAVDCRLTFVLAAEIRFWPAEILVRCEACVTGAFSTVSIPGIQLYVQHTPACVNIRQHTSAYVSNSESGMGRKSVTQYAGGVLARNCRNCHIYMVSHRETVLNAAVLTALADCI